ncbi:MAG TPA: TonB-dependent receptor [Acidobacteriota bacterium]|jgi:hypothetical protein
MFLSKLCPRAITFILVAAVACAVVLAQQRGSKLEGTVSDPSKAVIPGVLVVATNQETNVAAESYTNDSGLYVFPFLPPGTYTISAELPGFKKTAVTDFRLEVATTKTLNFTLTVGEITEAVTVKADSVQQIQLGTSDLGDVVFERKIKDLPLNGRLPIELIFLQPGMAGNNRQSSTGGLSANGARTVNNVLYMDGVNITNGELGTGSTSGILIATDVLPSVDTVEEFRVITGNPGAEYGRASGFQVNIVTKSGTNKVKGSVYEFYRGTVLNANTFFNNASPVKVERTPLLRNQFGGTIGGPVVIPGLYQGKNRTFFFFNYEGMRQSEAADLERTVLTSAARQGLYRFITAGVTRNPDTGAVLNSNSRVVVDPVTGALRPGVAGIQTLNMVDSDKRFFDGIGGDTTGLIKKIIDATPLPNTFTLTGDGLNTAGYRFNAPAKTKNDLFTIKIDHLISDKHNLSARANYGRLDRFGDVINGSFTPFPGGLTRTRLEDQVGYSLNIISSLKPKVTNEVRIGLSRNIRLFSVTVDKPGTLAVSPGIITNPFRIDELQITPRQTFQVTDNLSWLRGSHALKMGMTFQSTPLNQVIGNNAISLNFSSVQTGVGGALVNFPQLFGNPAGANPIPSANQALAGDLFNFLMGRIGSASADFNAISESEFGPLGTGKTRGFRERDWGFFFQDDWKVSRGLTLNLGVRYDWFQVPWEVNSFYVLAKNRQLLDTQLDPSRPHEPISFTRVGPKFGTKIFNNDLNNFAPIVGFSWDPWGKNRTAIRGSYRISYDRLYGRTLDTIESRAPGLNGTGQINGNDLSRLFGLTNAFGLARTPRLSDLANAPTNSGVSVGSGSINLGSILDISKTQKPLQAVPNTRLSLSPSDYEKNLVTPYSQSWSFGIQHEIRKNTVVEIRYVGRKGASEFAGLPANQFRAPAEILTGLQQLQGLLSLTNAAAYAKAGVPLPGSVNPNALVNIAALYGSTPANASSLNQYAPGSLAGLAPQSLFKLFLAGNNTFDQQVETNIRNNNLSSTIAAFDTSTLFHSNAFLTSAGLAPLPAGVDPRGWLPLAVGLRDNAFRPNIQFLNGPRLVSNAAYSSYHGMQLQFSRRFLNGLQAQANYTLSKNLDITSTTQPTGQSVTDFFQRNLDKSVSGNDVTHDFKSNFIYELPFGRGKRFGGSTGGFMNQFIGGWQVSSIIEVASAFPFGIGYGSQSSSWQGGDRPDFVPGAKVDGHTNDIGKTKRDAQGRVIYFTQDDFAGLFQPAKLGTVGNTPNRWLRGPGFWLVDFSVLKDFKISESRELQFRAEFFNVFNTVNFSNPNTNLESGNFGQITGQNGDPRLIQFALKLYF